MLILKNIVKAKTPFTGITPLASYLWFKNRTMNKLTFHSQNLPAICSFLHLFLACKLHLECHQFHSQKYTPLIKTM